MRMVGTLSQNHKVVRLKLASALAFLCLGIPPAIPDASTFSICYPKHSYYQQVASIREVDFRNLDLIIYYERGKKSLVAKLRKGLFQRDYPTHCYDWVKLNSVVYFEDASTAGEKALVTADWVSACASSDDTGIVQVFEISDGHPVALQQIEYNERGGGASHSFNPKTGTLTIKGAHGWEHCCPTTLDVGTFKWNESKFTLVKTASIPIPSVQ
jgi:hypothetical protein